MVFNYRIILLLILIEHYSAILDNYDNVIIISSVLGTELKFPIVEIDDENLELVSWYKGITDLKLLIINPISSKTNYELLLESTVSNRSHYSIVNQTQLIIKYTSIGDEGFYTLKIKAQFNTFKQYVYHVSSIFDNVNVSVYLSSMVLIGNLIYKKFITFYKSGFESTSDLSCRTIDQCDLFNYFLCRSLLH